MFTSLVTDSLLENVFESFDDLFKSSRLSYKEAFPPMNIHYGTNSKECFIEMALAGYKKEYLNIELKENVLTIEGKVPQEESKEDSKYLRRNIRLQNFKRVYEVPNVYDLNETSVSFVDGLLAISIPAKKKEEPAVKKIEIL